MRTDKLKQGLTAPICLTWELTYGCNLACVHCLSSSGRRDPDELSTAEAERVIDELAAMQVFYVNIGGGEPLVRRDFLGLLDHAVTSGVGVKFSTMRAAHAGQCGPSGATATRLPVTDGRAGPPTRGALESYPRPPSGPPGRGRLRPSRSAVVTATRTELDDLGPCAGLWRAAPGHPTAAVRAWRGDLAPAAPDGQPAAPAVPLAVGPPARPHRRLVLPPVGPWRAAPGPESVRGRAGGVPDRPGG